MDGSPVGKDFLKLLHSAGWCGHLSGLSCGCSYAAGHNAIRASRVPIVNTHSKCYGLVGFPEPAVSTGFVHLLLSALPNFRGA